MSRKSKDYSKFSKRQRISNFSKYKMIMNNDNNDNNVTFKKSVTNSTSPSIIRIVPSNKISIVGKNSVKAFIVKRSNNVKVENIPSTSHLESDHAHICKNENLYYDKNKFDDYDYVINDESINTEYCDQTIIQFKKSELSKGQIENNTLIIPEKINKIHCKTCCCSCRETLNIILQKQQEILNYLKHGQSFMQQERKLDLLPSMPFNDINDFLDFDESLTHENVQDQFIIKLKKLLVSTEQKSVSNIMSSIMTNELCRIISWIGIKNTIAFGTTNMVSLIIDLIQEHHHLDIDNGKARIAEWLRRCGDRIGNEIRKNRKRAQQGYST